MVAPNIEQISASLRNCSLGGRRETKTQHRQVPPPPPPPERQRRRRRRPLEDDSSDYAGITVDLNSEVPLPCYWDQCLDMRTGELYYINRADGTRATQDPRLATTSRRGCCSSSEEESSDDDDESEELGDASDDNEDIYVISSCYFSGGGDDVLVAVGCKSCFIYFMVPKRTAVCPNCGGGLLHLSRSGHL